MRIAVVVCLPQRAESTLAWEDRALITLVRARARRETQREHRVSPIYAKLSSRDHLPDKDVVIARDTRATKRHAEEDEIL